MHAFESMEEEEIVPSVSPPAVPRISGFRIISVVVTRAEEVYGLEAGRALSHDRTVIVLQHASSDEAQVLRASSASSEHPPSNKAILFNRRLGNGRTNKEKI